MSKVNIILIALIVVIVGGLAGGYFYMKDAFVPPQPAPHSPVAPEAPKVPISQQPQQGGIKKFKNYAELKKFLGEHASPASGYYGGLSLMRKSMLTQEIMPMASAPSFGINVAGIADGGMGGGGPEYSATNIQVEGVDEADIVKTDGHYIYTVTKNTINIVKAFPAENAELVSKIKFASSSPAGLFVNGNKLAVYGSDYSNAQSTILPKMRIRNQYTFLKTYDITDRKNPILERDLSFEGSYTNSRMIKDYIYFVTSRYQYDYGIDPMPVPYILNSGRPINAESEMPVYYFDAPYRSQSFVTATGVSISDKNQPPQSEIYLLDGNQQMYVSQNHIYITYTRYADEYQLTMDVTKEIVLPRLEAGDKERVQKIETADSQVLSEQEKMLKIMAVIQRYVESLGDDEQKALETEMKNRVKQKYEDISKELEKTIIHKIAISEGKLAYQTVGEVTGHILNQFSMDEDNGYFRIATTKSQSWSRFSGESNEPEKSYNNLYILDSSLKVAGKIENLATDERIYSVRFMQGRAYIVTFKQTDPLFVIDVSDPTAPKVLGELKIPGFSNYLHPYDDTMLIGLGKETETNQYGAVIPKGLKISLFDVADVANPKETAHYTVEGQWSDSGALYDHKAFLFKKDKNLLAIPVTAQKDSGQFQGAFVFDVTKNTIALKGQVSHPSAQSGYDYFSQIKRGLYIENNLYTLSNAYLGINNLADLALIKNIGLRTVEIKEPPVRILE